MWFRLFSYFDVSRTWTFGQNHFILILRAIAGKYMVIDTDLQFLKVVLNIFHVFSIDFTIFINYISG